MTMRLPSLLLLCAVSFSGGLASAHETAKGPNGGRVLNIGDLHAEFVVAADTVAVFLSDANHKPVAPAGFKGVAIVVIGDKGARIPLEPAGDKLSGNAPGISPEAKGAIQIVSPGGKTSQARLN